MTLPLPPPWLARWRRISAALVAGEALSQEDAGALLGALTASAQSRWDDGATSIERALGLPAKWRTLKRHYDQRDVLGACVAAGHRGRRGARQLHRMAR